MANPAELLYQSLKSWQTTSPARQSRKLNPPTQEAFSQLRFAVMNLEAIRETVRSMKQAGQNVETWEGAIDRWTAGIFLFSGGWTNPQSSSLNDGDLRLLDAFGQLMQNWIRVLKPDGLDEIKSFIADIEQVANTGIDDPQLSLHLRNVLNHVKWCVENFSNVGEFELDKALNQLASTVLLLNNNESTPGKPSRWSRFIDKWVNPFVVGAIAGMAGNISSNMLMASVGAPALGPGAS